MDELIYSPIELEILDAAAEDQEDSVDDYLQGDSDGEAIDMVEGEYDGDLDFACNDGHENDDNVGGDEEDGC